MKAEFGRQDCMAVVENSLPSTASPDDSAYLTNAQHRVESQVKRELQSDPGLRFSSLVVRRINDGVCLEGVLDVDDTVPDVDSLARRVAGVNNVLNHLVLRQSRQLPSKG